VTFNPAACAATAILVTEFGWCRSSHLKSTMVPPVAAAGSMVTRAVALVGLVTVTGPA
jgi:hypothetical protein